MQATRVLSEGKRHRDSVQRFAGLAADSHGEPDQRPPLVLLHGLTFDRSMWRPALESLHTIDPGRQVVAFDLPGHGESSDLPSYEIDSVVDALHRAIEEAGLQAPVVVGHSMSAIVATAYAAQQATRGVVNVDQPLQVAPFGELVKSLADKIRGPGFPAVWSMLAAGFHTELLPQSSQELVLSTCRPRQEVVVGYWKEVLDRPISEIMGRAEGMLTRLKTAGLPYVVVAGDDLEPR
jgi:pimeloyl-ACP methyl ester carboxylesterase